MSEADERDDWPHPNTRPCSDCGHVWFPGERPHEYADEPGERPEDVPVVCTLCRHQRALPRHRP